MKTTPAVPDRHAEAGSFIGRKHAAAKLDVDPQTIDKFIRRGQLRAFRVGRRVVVKLDDLMRLVEANEVI